MKYLLVTLEYPPDVGGIAEYYKGLVDALPKGSVTVMTPRTHRFFFRWFWPHWLPLLWNAWRVVRREKPDEIFIGQILPIGTAVWILKQLLVTRYSLPVTLFCHGMDILQPQRSRWKTWLVKKILATADRVVANSQYTKGELMKLGVLEGKIRVVYPCPRLTREHENTKTQEQLIDHYRLHGKRILLTAARLVQRKGIDLVIAAVAKIKDQFPDLMYVILGDGPERTTLAAQCTTLNAPCIFVGPVTELMERAAWFELCDMYIGTPRTLPYDVESFGLVYLEANLFGKPVIGSTSGGVLEAVIDGETGLLVSDGNIDAIAGAITKLCADQSLRHKLGQQGKYRVEQEFVWVKQIQKLV